MRAYNKDGKATTEFTMFLFVAIALAVCLPATAAPVLIQGVPAYQDLPDVPLGTETRRAGCTPTSVGMVMGYWDLHGYSNLFNAQGNNLYLTANVLDEISSPAHNAKYDPTPDNPNLPVPPKTSIADFLLTSADMFGRPLGEPGGTWPDRAKPGIEDYASYKHYSFQATSFRIGSGLLTEDQLWPVIVAEIDAGRPTLLNVDSSGDGSVDHSVVAIGYEDRGINGKWYACYDTWSEQETPVWKGYHKMLSGFEFGVSSAIQVIPDPIPEPTTIALLALSLPLVLRRRKATPTRQ